MLSAVFVRCWVKSPPCWPILLGVHPWWLPQAPLHLVAECRSDHPSDSPVPSLLQSLTCLRTKAGLQTTGLQLPSPQAPQEIGAQRYPENQGNEQKHPNICKCKLSLEAIVWGFQSCTNNPNWWSAAGRQERSNRDLSQIPSLLSKHICNIFV